MNLRNAKIGFRVEKIMGVRMDGTIIDYVYYKDADDGTYRPPEKKDRPVYVRWDDGTKGWICASHISLKGKSYESSNSA